MTSISIRFTWPSPSVCCTGPSQRATPAANSVTAARTADRRYPSIPNVSQKTAVSDVILAIVKISPKTGIENAAKAANISAAIGG
jgi:hypothetical protein